jgi:hypothetical protein
MKEKLFFAITKSKKFEINMQQATLQALNYIFFSIVQEDYLYFIGVGKFIVVEMTIKPAITKKALQNFAGLFGNTIKKN